MVWSFGQMVEFKHCWKHWHISLRRRIGKVRLHLESTLQGFHMRYNTTWVRRNSKMVSWRSILTRMVTFKMKADCCQISISSEQWYRQYIQYLRSHSEKKITQKLWVSMILMFCMTLTMNFNLAAMGSDLKVVLSSYIIRPRIIEIESKLKKNNFNTKKSVFTSWHVLMTSYRKNKDRYREHSSRAWKYRNYIDINIFKNILLIVSSSFSNLNFGVQVKN